MADQQQNNAPMPSAQQTQEKAVQLARERRDLGATLQGEKFRSALAAIMPKHCTPDRFVRMVLTATMRTPDLLKCSQESFFRCCFDLSALGLEPDGRRAHLIPRKTGNKCICGDWRNKHRGDGPCTMCACAAFKQGMECTLVVDYKGLVDLVRRSGEVAYIHADVVCEGDDFEFRYGSGAFLEHKPNLQERGRMYAAYSFVKLKDGSEDFMVLSRQDVEKVRAVSPAKDDGPWVSFFDEMARKTAFRRHSKWLPFSSELREKIEREDVHNPIETAAAEDTGRAMLSLDAFRVSDDEHRGHDESMTQDQADKFEAQEHVATGQPPELSETASATDKKSEQPKQRAQSTHRGPVKPVEELSDAMDFRIGYECYQGGRHWRVVEDGDFQKWFDVGEAPTAKPKEETAAATAEPEKQRGRGSKPNAADLFK